MAAGDMLFLPWRKTHPMDESLLKDLLARENEDFRRLADEHRACESELDRLRTAVCPSEADELAERDLKKRKLALKDRMYRMMADFGRDR